MWGIGFWGLYSVNIMPLVLRKFLHLFWQWLHMAELGLCFKLQSLHRCFDVSFGCVCVFAFSFCSYFSKVVRRMGYMYGPSSIFVWL